MQEIRCYKCGKLLGKINGTYEIKCTRCRGMNINKEDVEISVEYEKLFAEIFRQAVRDDVKEVCNTIFKELRNRLYEKKFINDFINKNKNDIENKVMVMVYEESQKWPDNMLSDTNKNLENITRETLKLFVIGFPSFLQRYIGLY